MFLIMAFGNDTSDMNQMSQNIGSLEKNREVRRAIPIVWEAV